MNEEEKIIREVLVKYYKKSIANKKLIFLIYFNLIDHIGVNFESFNRFSEHIAAPIFINHDAITILSPEKGRVFLLNFFKLRVAKLCWILKNTLAFEQFLDFIAILLHVQRIFWQNHWHSQSWWSLYNSILLDFRHCVWDSFAHLLNLWACFDLLLSVLALRFANFIWTVLLSIGTIKSDWILIFFVSQIWSCPRSVLESGHL